ncbi:hypothetical protein EF847_02045 [Actinobacteria bacterium YIM 96077]|uniref:Uncharacterized protein n=1 Tax=Phytoactinopolyspora halophila TaxID=1981511 RepID=A0A329R1P3_9ACTN|nr:hypothetical protein [Phytoactinopolyspora halophila]AYY11688.1 hypothetical protein EF847_02045 [Actinobacteria bacterium YIM 96077]RAW17879.1 hypothetical protein DPM12_03235 [Phytoactinopolyspora halophila]
MNFDIFLQRFTGGDVAPTGRVATVTVLERYLADPPAGGYTEIITRDGRADVYGLDGDGLMINHAEGRDVFELMFQVSKAAGYVIMPVGSPTCVLDESMIPHLPEVLRHDAVVVSSGDDLLRVILTT